MTSFQSVLVIRADADSTIGSGHVMRCLAIAQAWLAAGGQVKFVSRDLPDSLRDRLIGAGCTMEKTIAQPGSEDDGDCLTTIARAVAADWVIVDGYSFDVEFQRRVMAATKRLLVVRDDDRPTRVWATSILNANPFAQREFYPADSAAEFLLGPSFALLREEFRNVINCASNVALRVRRVLVTFGGADPNDMTSRALAAFERFK